MYKRQVVGPEDELGVQRGVREQAECRDPVLPRVMAAEELQQREGRVRTCADGSTVADQVWVRDSQGEVHGAAISLDC